MFNRTEDNLRASQHKLTIAFNRRGNRHWFWSHGAHRSINCKLERDLRGLAARIHQRREYLDAIRRIRRPLGTHRRDCEVALRETDAVIEHAFTFAQSKRVEIFDAPVGIQLKRRRRFTQSALHFIGSIIRGERTRQRERFGKHGGFIARLNRVDGCFKRLHNGGKRRANLGARSEGHDHHIRRA